MDKFEALKFAQKYLESYYNTYGMGVKEIIGSQWARGVFFGRQEALNILQEAIVKEAGECSQYPQ